MLSKATYACLLAFTSIAMPAHAQFGDLSIDSLIEQFNLSPTEAAAASMIAQTLHLGPKSVIDAGQRTGQSLITLGPAFVMARQSHRSVDDVWQIREKNQGWGEVAHELGIHPGTFNKMRKNGDFGRACWSDMVYRRYKYSPSVIASMERRGMRTRDWVTASAISNGDRRRLTVISSGWKPGKSWNGHEGEAHGKSQSKGKSHDKGGGNGKGQSGNKGKGHGNGNGKGNGNSGKSHGKGRGG
jgi:hypothetical protein